MNSAVGGVPHRRPRAPACERYANRDEERGGETAEPHAECRFFGPSLKVLLRQVIARLARPVCADRSWRSQGRISVAT